MAFVYLLGEWKNEGCYKIGVTRGSIDKRIKKLQTGNSSEIFINRWYETKHPFFIEKILHQRYKPKQILNEWYSLTPQEVLAFPDTCTEIESMISSLENNPFFPKNPK